MRSGFHFPKVDRSPVLQVIVEILKSAAAPLTSNDIYELAKDRGVTLSASAIGSNLDAIRNNEGYAVSPAIRGDDGKYRYWLQSAPGWTPRWTADARGTVNAASWPKPAAHEPEESQNEPEMRLCKNPSCRKPIDHGHTCNEACNAAWKESIFTKPEGALL